MKSHEFITAIINEYQLARLSRFGNADKIRRGRSHTISSTIEDLFAQFLLANNPEIDFIYVDQPMKYGRSRRPFYPDVSVVKDNEIVAMFDLKTDLGWMRRKLVKVFKNHDKKAKLVAGKKCTLKDGQTKATPLGITFAENVTYSIVVLSDHNITRTSLAAHMDNIIKLGSASRVYILAAGAKYHLNEYGVTPQEIVDGVDMDGLALVCEEILKELRLDYDIGKS